jgi:POT family proton-dependent oligopeptide transporter
MFGLLNLYAHEELDRRIGSFEVPTTWMQTISLCSFFVSIPALSWLWRHLALTGRNPSASYKLALGIAALAAAYALIAMGEGLRGSEKTGMTWLIATYLLFGVGDALVWPNQISLTSKLAPARFAALLVGSWYLCIGIGTWLAGQLGAVAGAYEFGAVFFALAGGCAAVAVVLALLTPALIGRMHGKEQEDRVSAA